MKNESLNNVVDPNQIDHSWDDLMEQPISSEINSIHDIKPLKPKEQFKYLSSIAETAQADTEYAHFVAKNIFDGIINDDGFSPLVKIIAENSKKSSLGLDYDNYDEAPPKENDGYDTIISLEMIPEFSGLSQEEDLDEDSQSELEKYQADILKNLSLKKSYFQKNQAKLHQEFPVLPKDKQLVKIASDAAAVVEFQKKYDPNNSWFSLSSSFGEISDLDGNIVSVTNEDLATYFAEIHNNSTIKALVEQKLNTKLSDISLESQMHLLKFMSEADNTRFDKLCETLGNIEKESLKRDLLENFVAADFGEDFGDSLLTIANAEHLSDKKKEKIFHNINSCRKSIHDIASLYLGLDNGDFAEKYARAANERLTDAVAVFDHIAKKGSVEADLDWAGKPKFDYESAIEALSYEAKSLEIIGGTIDDVTKGKEGAFAEVVLPPEYYSQFTLYNFYSPNHGYVLLYTRPEGSGTFDESLEYGKKNSGTEASISFIANPKKPFDLPKPFKPDQAKIRDFSYYDYSTMDKVSALRIDREGRAPDAPVDTPERNPINNIGTISVDLAAINDRADTPSGKIARLFSAGNKLRESINEGKLSLNHNTKWFDQAKYGTSGGFKEIVEYIDSMASKWCEKYKPNANSAQSFSKLFKQARGSKARRAA